MRTELFVYFCIKKYIETQAVKSIFNPCPPPPPPTVVYATDRSKEVVPVIFLILCGFVVYTMGCFMF